MWNLSFKHTFYILVILNWTIFYSIFTPCLAYWALKGTSNGLFSESADQFCSATPTSKIIELPDGCTFNDQSYFDVGECTPDPCRGGNQDTGTCADDQDNAYCCGPTVYSVVEIPCEDGDDEDFTISINMAKECGCALCPERQLSVAGEHRHNYLRSLQRLSNRWHLSICLFVC